MNSKLSIVCGDSIKEIQALRILHKYVDPSASDIRWQVMSAYKSINFNYFISVDGYRVFNIDKVIEGRDMLDEHGCTSDFLEFFHTYIDSSIPGDEILYMSKDILAKKIENAIINPNLKDVIAIKNRILHIERATPVSQLC